MDEKEDKGEKDMEKEERKVLWRKEMWGKRRTCRRRRT